VRSFGLREGRGPSVIHAFRGLPVVENAVRGDIPKGTAEIFFRKVKFWKGDPSPVFVSFHCGAEQQPAHTKSSASLQQVASAA
jgi:hypothetical protein